VDLRTTYLGLALPHPAIPGASPLTDQIHLARRLEDAGAPALVMRSLFAERLAEPPVTVRHALGCDEYVRHLEELKAAVGVPVIVSLNGARPGPWIEAAPLLEAAGADALELNLYRIAVDPDVSSAEVEREMLDAVSEVRRRVRLPLAVKLTPFFTTLTPLAMALAAAGANALVLFNRYYEPDVFVAGLPPRSGLRLSSPAELGLRLTWTAILSAQVPAEVAITGGVHAATDVVRAVMAGAHAVQVVSALLSHGPEHLRTIVSGLATWMADHGWASVDQMRGHTRVAMAGDTTASARAAYYAAMHDLR
jgi:dihydroorotate dehydrogenase (fumarate)